MKRDLSLICRMINSSDKMPLGRPFGVCTGAPALSFETEWPLPSLFHYLLDHNMKEALGTVNLHSHMCCSHVVFLR